MKVVIQKNNEENEEDDEIELKKIVQIDDKKVLLSRIENIESKFELIPNPHGKNKI